MTGVGCTQLLCVVSSRSCRTTTCVCEFGGGTTPFHDCMILREADALQRGLYVCSVYMSCPPVLTFLFVLD